uniref:RasGEF domain family member 1A n=1 Tax=Monodelphis domestica TaxID=13616 RepID=A0A5F8GML4_MONDO
MYILQKTMRETMPQTPIFSSMLGSSCSGQVQPDMGERSGGDLVFQDGNLISGSLEALIEHLVPTVDYYPDRTYIFTFLLSSRIFIPPYDLLAKVGQICTKQKQQLEAETEKAKLKSFTAKIIQLLKEWTEAFPYDFQDEKVMKELKEITHKITQCDEENGTVKTTITQMTQNLILSLTTRNQFQEIREKFRQPVTDKGTILKSKPQAAQKDILSVCCDPLILAQQLTHIELCRGDVTKTYTLEAYDNWFNCLSMLVATEICRVVKKKQRTRMVEFFIDVARECFNIGNFNSMMAIISGMNLSPVARLKKTWSKVKTAKFDVLEHHMDPSSNFCNYRTALQGAAQRSQTANSSREKIVIPVFNLFIKDIYFLHKIHTNRLPNGQINFKKFWEISRQIHDFLTWKQVECPFEKDKKIQSYLLTAPIYSEEALFVASFESEGPENHMEKDSWKTLRTTLLNRA